MGKKTSLSKTELWENLPHAPLGGDAVLVPSGERTSPKLSDIPLITAQGPDTGVKLPAFTLVPRRSSQSKSSPSAKHRTVEYGGHRLIISGSMSDELPGPPSFTVTPAKKTHASSKPNTEPKRKK